VEDKLLVGDTAGTARTVGVVDMQLLGDIVEEVDKRMVVDTVAAARNFVVADTVAHMLVVAQDILNCGSIKYCWRKYTVLDWRRWKNSYLVVDTQKEDRQFVVEVDILVVGILVEDILDKDLGKTWMLCLFWHKYGF
jgi:hypothetical protein